MPPDGHPQSGLGWVDYDGECACVNTTRQRQKGRNMQLNPKVSPLVVDADDTGRYLQIRGDAELLEEGPLDHLDRLSRKYTRHRTYYGCVNPPEQQVLETRVICRIRARAITCDAIPH
jgi:PPOX class probable F420-dependent enzyme